MTSFLIKLRTAFNRAPLSGFLMAQAREKKVRRERKQLAMSYYEAKIRSIDGWLSESRETTNFTYDLTELNLRHLAATLSVVCKTSEFIIRQYLDEILMDQEFREHVREITRQAPSSIRDTADPEPRVARRAGWYAVVRAIKPKVVVETGIDKGLGSCVLCAALLRNASEGHDGHYYGTEINPDAGWLLGGRYEPFGTILYGDSLESLKKFAPSIDVFINDSDHSAEYERAEYEAIDGKLTGLAVILGDNAHCNSELHDFSVRQGRQFLYWEEKPKDHWYPGGGIGFSYLE